MATVLVVDDIEDNIQMLTFDLEDDGHKVISASNGVECLAIAMKQKPQLILLDMMMPVMDGLETLKRLKSDPELQGIPVIMVSADDHDEGIVEALDIGAHDFVTKPFVYPILAARIRSALRLKSSQDELEQINHQLELLASTDPLTGCYNRRMFFKLARAEFSKSIRTHRPLSVIMCDIDRFKSINDTHGHSAGDVALVNVARILTECRREGDIVCRMGGEEFMLCLPDTDVTGATKLAERIRVKIEGFTITLEDQTQFQLTSSFGVASIKEDINLDKLANRADQYLYEAKELGRNRCVTHD